MLKIWWNLIRTTIKEYFLNIFTLSAVIFVFWMLSWVSSRISSLRSWWRPLFDSFSDDISRAFRCDVSMTWRTWDNSFPMSHLSKTKWRNIHLALLILYINYVSTFPLMKENATTLLFIDPRFSNNSSESWPFVKLQAESIESSQPYSVFIKSPL